MSSLPFAELSGAAFYVLGDRQNDRDSDVIVRTDNTRDGKGVPVLEGIQDPHMGSYDHTRCATCSLTGQESYSGAICPGHHGSIQLNYPVMSPLFIPVVVKWLKVLCHHCGRLVLRKDLSRVRDDQKLTELAKTRQTDRVLVCACGKQHLDVRHDRKHPTEIYRRLPGETGKRDKNRPLENLELMYPEEIYQILNRVTPEILAYLGCSEVTHPRRFVLHTVRAPPNTIRPDGKSGGTNRTQNDDLTLGFKALLTANNQLPPGLWRRPPAEAKEHERAIRALNLCYYGVIKDANAANLNMTNNRKMTSLVMRWRGKPGRIRRNLLGRRVVHISRSFITCDNSLKYYEVGVPLHTARKQGITIAVQPHNYEECLRYYLNGERIWPGATKLTQDGKEYDVEKRLAQGRRPETGDLLQRNIIDGDAVGFNRQPSLEPSSVSCMRVVVYPSGDTFRMNVGTCNLFNADFDGDAMHLIWMNRLSTANEMWHLAGVPQFFISYKNGAPKLGEVQDAIAGLSRLTAAGTRLSTYHAMGLLADVDLFPRGDFALEPAKGGKGDSGKSKGKEDSGKGKAGKEDSGKGKGKAGKEDSGKAVAVSSPASRAAERPLIPGRDVISTLLRLLDFEISYSGKPSLYNKNFQINYDPQDISVRLERGVLVQGILDGEAVGQESRGSLFHIVHNQYGAKAAMDLAHYLQLIGIRYIMQRGITIGIKDTVLPSATLQALQTEEAKFIQLSRNITRRLDEGKIIPPIGMTVGQRFEEEQIHVLKEQPKAENAFWTTISNSINPATNQLFHIIMTGAKGKPWNLLSISLCVGQLLIDGARMPENFNRRSLLYFPRYDPDPEARGYVPNSYLAGLSVPSFCFHAMDSRTTIVRRALSTAVTGHQSRKSIKSLEATLVDNLRRTTNGRRVVQQLYGGDGVDPRFVERVKLPTMAGDLSLERFEGEYRSRQEHFAREYHSKGLEAALDAEYEQLLTDRRQYREIVLRLVEGGGLGQYTEEAFLAINIPRIINTVRGAVDGSGGSTGGLGQEGQGKAAARLDPLAALAAVREFCATLPYALYNGAMEAARTPLPEYAHASCTMVLMHVRSWLNLAKIRKEHHLDNALLEAVLAEARRDYARALISYGKTVGNLAAQSLSEPMTQLVLDSHHGAGAGSAGRDSLDTVRDLLSVRATHGGKKRGTSVAEVESKVISGMTLQVRAPHCYSREQVQTVANELEMVDLRRFVGSSQILYEEYGKGVHPLYRHENALVEEFHKYFLQKATEESRAAANARGRRGKNVPKTDRVASVPHDLTRWCMRLQLDKTTMVEKQMDMTLIVLKLRAAFGARLWLVHSPENAPVAVLRLYLRGTVERRERVELLLRDVLNTVIRGVPGIKSTSIRERKQYLSQPDGTLRAVPHFYITTAGSNLVRVMEHPRVDPESCQSTSLPEMMSVYGVMVTRTKLLNMLKQSIDKVSHRHYMLYADEMTFHGSVTAINNFGSAKRGASFLLQISDEQPLKAIVNSAVSSAYDPLEGISAPILLGKTPRVGDMFNRYVFNADFARRKAKSVSGIVQELLRTPAQ